jgi:putative addiction module component (TIGR02574 family)
MPRGLLRFDGQQVERADMKQTLESVLQVAIALPEAERAQLVDALIASFDPADAAPLDDAWLAEIQRRSAEFDAGLIQTSSWSEVRDRARARAKPIG